MKILDISRPIQTEHKYPTAPNTVFTQVDSIARGAECNYSLISTNTHAGTHADAEIHFLMNGAGIGAMDLNIYYGSIRVLTFKEHTILDKEDFEGKIEDVERVGLHGADLPISMKGLLNIWYQKVFGVW